MSSTSGGFAGNDLGNARYIHVDWQLAAQEIGNNRSLINWQAYAHFYNSDNQLDNGSVTSNVGTLWSNGGRVKNFTGVVSGHRDVGLASGSFWVNHDSVGNGAVQLGVSLAYYGTGTSAGTSGVWDLPTIPRYPTIISDSGTITDEATNVFINFSNPYGGTVSADLYIRPLGSTGAFNNFAHRASYISGANFSLTTAEINSALATLTGTTQGQLLYRVTNGVGNTDDGWGNDKLLNVINATPTFLDYTYADTNAAITAVTGNNQVAVQNKSTIRATITTANKMIANKGATAVNYSASLDGAVVSQPYSASATVNADLGVVANAGSKNISIAAIDSRGLNISVIKALTVVPYATPVINLTATRQNNFDATTTVVINGVYSRVIVGGADKNSINTGTLQYRLRQDGGSWSSWVTVAFTQTAGTFSTTDTLLSLVNSSVFDIEVHITDKFETATVSTQVGRGIPILMISDNKEAIGVNKMPDGSLKGLYLLPTDNLFNQIYPINSIYMSVSSTNPSSYFGGTWVAWGTGRVPVGIDTTQTEFNTVEKTGGAKTQALTALIGAVNGNTAAIGYRAKNASATTAYTYAVVGSNVSISSINHGTEVLQDSGASPTTLQPYITCYMWKRTA